MAKYNLVFQGEIIAGTSLEEVTANLARLFKADAAKTAALFSGQSIIIKRDLDPQSAKKYLMVLKQAGAVVKALKVVGEAATEHTNQNIENSQKPEPAQTPAGATLSSGLAALISYNHSSPDKHSDNSAAVDDLHLAPLGANIPNLQHDNTAIIIPDLSHLSLSEAESGSLEEFSQKSVAVELPDISKLSMSAANEGSLEEFTSKPDPVPLPDISRLNISEPDNTPLSSETSKTEPVAIPDTSQLSMSDAQQGSLEGLQKKPEPATIPDTRHLSMAGTETTPETNKPQGKAVFQID